MYMYVHVCTYSDIVMAIICIWTHNATKWLLALIACRLHDCTHDVAVLAHCYKWYKYYVETIRSQVYYDIQHFVNGKQ